MDLFLAACQGAGLALAAGALTAAPGRRAAIGFVLLAAALIGGAVLFGLSLEEEDHPAYPGWPVGALLGGFTFLVVRAVAEGAARRAEGSGFTAILIVIAAILVAILSLLLPPVAIAFLLALCYLAAARRRRSQRKYEGLRTLR
jgi:hypothetical protein